MTLIAENCISPELAQRKVTQFLIISLGDRAYGGSPEGCRDDCGNFYWAVPVIVDLPEGNDFQAGHILVDAETGHIKLEDNILEEIRANVQSQAEG